MSRVCCVALSHDVTSLTAVVIVVFPNDTHLLFLFKKGFQPKLWGT